MTYEHIFKITNEGPSPIYHETKAQIFVPITDVSLMGSISPSDTCLQTSNAQTDIFNVGDSTDKFSYPMACNTVKCRIYECTFPPGWLKSDIKEVKVKMVFTSQAANEDPDHDSFAMFTHLKIDQVMSHSVTEMVSVKVGLAQRLIQHWPIVLGLVLVLILVTVVIVAIFKITGFNILNKLRFFKEKLDDEENKAIL
jgi:hypothetical protein